MNKVMLIGNLGRDPEMTYTPSGTAVCKFSIAVTRFSKQNGERVSETEWFNIVLWKQLAETAFAYLRKGNKVFIEGRFQSHKFTDKNGVERTSYDVVVSDMEFLTPKSENREEKKEEFEEVDPSCPF